MRKRLCLAIPLLVASLGLGFIFNLFGASTPKTVQAAEEADLNITRLHPKLAKAIAKAENDDFFPIIIEWARDPDLAGRAATAPDKLTRRVQIIAALEAETQIKTWALNETLLKAQETGLARRIRRFWVSPVIALQAQKALIVALSQREDLVQIRLDDSFHLGKIDPVFNPDVTQDEFPGNLKMVKVDLTQDALGLDGNGVVVANMDTGVDWQHPALLKKYRGYRSNGLSIHDGNWYVATNEIYQYPGDALGHGTHTMGIMVGDDGEGNRIGVAPGAQWIAVKVFNNHGTTFESWIHAGFEWLMAPEGDPSLAPDVVNNSWSSVVGESELFRPDVKALNEAGIVSIFSAGNEGPQLETIGSPASYPESIAVGAVDEERFVASFSSRGPSPWDEIKPEVAAPGTKVRSSYPGGGYVYLNGTSMAAPHVAGLAALMLQANPALSPVAFESLLKTTAEPLGEVAPNNATGWGLVNAYAAALKVTESGELIGRVVRSDGGYVSEPEVSAELHGGGHAASILGDERGEFTIALAPGIYDVTARAFGFEPETKFSLQIITGTVHEITLTLSSLPVGSVFGTVKDAQSGAPLSATIQVEGTPVEVQTNSNNGAYSLALPSGSWRMDVIADAYRVGHITATVTAGVGSQLDIALEPSPRILLVDSGRWYYESQIQYFEESLDSLDYHYDLWSIRHPFGFNSGEDDRPLTSTLNAYDVVIWSAPLDSPAFLGLNGVITTYLNAGGNLLLSGQDVAFWDGGGNILVYSTYFPAYIGVRFKDEGNLNPLTGVTESALEGLSVRLNGPDTANQQVHPDAVEFLNLIFPESSLEWSDKSIGGVLTEGCLPFRVAWLGFGFEGAGPPTTRTELLRRLMDWFQESPTPYGVYAESGVEPLLGLPGSTVSQTIDIYNTGIHTDTYDLVVNPGPWGIELAFPGGNITDRDTSVTIGACSRTTITATVSIPLGLPRNVSSESALQLISQTDPSIENPFTVTAKTPAPVLFVDDERWENFSERYTSILDSSPLKYDVMHTGGRSLDLQFSLTEYDLVVWATGKDWFSPLGSQDEEVLSDYLERGGRLILSSQDLLDVSGVSEFVSTYLGVSHASLSITPTQVLAVPGNPLGDDFGPWDLDFPFENYGDAVYPTPGARSVLLESDLKPVGILHPTGDYRVAFYSFALEGLTEPARSTLLGRSLLWISSLGESRLSAPPVASSGSRIPVELTLGSATSQPQSGLKASLPLPTEFSLVSESIIGPWDYDTDSHTLIWEGTLERNEKVVLGAELEISPAVPGGIQVPLQAHLDAGNGLTLTAEADVQIGVPWVKIDKQVTPESVLPGGFAQYAIFVENEGVALSTVSLTDTLPGGVVLIPGTLQSTSGEITWDEAEITWEGLLEPGETALISYEVGIESIKPDKLINWVEGEDGYHRRLTWVVLSVTGNHYLPIIRK